MSKQASSAKARGKGSSRRFLFRHLPGRWWIWGPGVLVLLAAVAWWFVPDGSEYLKRYPEVTAMMRQQGYGTEAAPMPVPLGRISPWLVHMVIMAEDDRFFLHQGLDWKGMQEAMETNIRRHRWAAGGSGITQQLSKNLYWGGSKNLLRKLAEGVSAMKMERTLGKRRILELYLNVIEWGRGVYGIGRASKVLLKKRPAEITAEEAIRLASILPNPRRFSLHDQSRRMVRKRRILARRLMQKGLIGRDEWKRLYGLVSR